MANPSNVIIAEIMSGRKVTLKGRYLPFRGVGYPAVQRTQKTTYPGNSEATQQILGTELEPTLMVGSWSDRFVTDSVDVVGFDVDVVTAAAQLVKIIEDMRDSGRELRVEWAHEIRKGLIKRFEASYSRREDLAWEMEFEWNAADGQTAVVASTDSLKRPDINSSMNTLDDMFAFRPLTIRDVPEVDAAARQITGALDLSRRGVAFSVSTIATFRKEVGIIFDVIRTIDTLIQAPRSIFGAMSSAVETIRAEGESEIGRLSSVPYSELSEFRGIAAVTSGETFRRNLSASLQSVTIAALETEKEFATASQLRGAFTDSFGGANDPALLGAARNFTMPADMTLYQVSTRFYGDPDFAGFLADANGLDSVIVPAGTKLRIPSEPRREVC